MKYPIGCSLLLAGSLVSCGGGSSGSAQTQTASPTNSTPVAFVPNTPTLAQGVVTGFGSVIVNGIHYDVKDAAIEVDGDSQIESDLKVGQFVTIDGSLSADGIHGKAAKLKGDSQLVAPIDSIDLNAGVIVALGVPVLITADTFYDDGLTAATLKVGDIIRVCSFTNTDGQLVATRIDIKKVPTPGLVQLAGKVSELDAVAQTFTLNGKKVDYSKATLNDLPNKLLANDMQVRVHGTLQGEILLANGNVHLSALDIKHHDNAKHNMHLQSGGLVSGLIPNVSFTQGDVTVLLTANTQFEGGVAADLVDGIMAKVHGTLDANKNLVAKKIKLIFNVKVEDEGVVQAIDLAANTFTVNAVTYEVSADTSVNDGSHSKMRFFNIKDLNIGDQVDVRGYKKLNDANRMVATRIERHNAPEKGTASARVFVKGKIDSVTDGVISINAHLIKIPDALKVEGFANAQAFLAAAVGLVVEVKGTMENNVFVARSLEMDDESEHEAGDHQGPGPAHDGGDKKGPGSEHESDEHNAPDAGAGVDPAPMPVLL